MKEYKMIECQKTEAEMNMNVMAAQGWELHSVTYWTKWGVCLLLTFEPGSVTTLFWYAPLGDKITGGVHVVSNGVSQALLEGLTPGIRFLKVFYAEHSPSVRQLSLRPGRDTIIGL